MYLPFEGVALANQMPQSPQGSVLYYVMAQKMPLYPRRAMLLGMCLIPGRL